MPVKGIQQGNYLLQGVAAVLLICIGALGFMGWLRPSSVMDVNLRLAQQLALENLAMVPSGQPLRHPQRFNPPGPFRYAPYLRYDFLAPGQLFLHFFPEYDKGNAVHAVPD